MVVVNHLLPVDFLDMDNDWLGEHLERNAHEVEQWSEVGSGPQRATIQE